MAKSRYVLQHATRYSPRFDASMFACYARYSSSNKRACSTFIRVVVSASGALHSSNPTCRFVQVWKAISCSPKIWSHQIDLCA